MGTSRLIVPVPLLIRVLKVHLHARCGGDGSGGILPNSAGAFCKATMGRQRWPPSFAVDVLHNYRLGLAASYS